MEWLSFLKCQLCFFESLFVQRSQSGILCVWAGLFQSICREREQTTGTVNTAEEMMTGLCTVHWSYVPDSDCVWQSAASTELC